jgi:hypothetical protein
MNNNGIIEHKESFISKIKKIFKGIFEKKEKQNNYAQVNSLSEPKQEKDELQSGFVNDLKVDSKAINTVDEKENFLREIDGNEETLNMLSIDRLKKLEKYYDSIIEQNNEKIKKLKESL